MLFHIIIPSKLSKNHSFLCWLIFRINFTNDTQVLKYIFQVLTLLIILIMGYSVLLCIFVKKSITLTVKSNFVNIHLTWLVAYSKCIIVLKYFFLYIVFCIAGKPCLHAFLFSLLTYLVCFYIY